MVSWITLVLGTIGTIVPSYYVSHTMNVHQQKVYEKTIDAVVFVNVKQNEEDVFHFGTGFFVNDEIIVAVAHYFPSLKQDKQPDVLAIQFHKNWESCGVKLLELNKENDLALLKLTDKSSRCRPKNNGLSFVSGQSKPHFGQRIYALGNSKNSPRPVSIETNYETIVYPQPEIVSERGFVSSDVQYLKQKFYAYEIGNDPKSSMREKTRQLDALNKKYLLDRNSLDRSKLKTFKANVFFTWLHAYNGLSGGPVVDRDGKVLGIIKGLVSGRTSFDNVWVIYKDDILKLLDKNEIKITEH